MKPNIAVLAHDALSVVQFRSEGSVSGRPLSMMVSRLAARNSCCSAIVVAVATTMTDLSRMVVSLMWKFQPSTYLISEQ